ncbi:MAG: type II toxin-antitoxin system RelE/ParE family toxin [Candidatus Woesebacteria bacterium]|nr:type II toxin-antitoxin system RelE/ParE family toxin [Candidatus Woesebacteria bacterium]
MYEVRFTNKAEKELTKIAGFDRKNLLKRITQITFPFPQNYDIDKLSGGEGFYRLRTGNVRTFIEVDQKNKQIWVRKIKYRGGAYKF